MKRRRGLTTTEQGLGWRWQQVRLVILQRDRRRCHWCGGPANTVDHITPRSRGGARYNPANLVACCRSCNSRRGATLARRKGEPATSRGRRVWAGILGAGTQP